MTVAAVPDPDGFVDLLRHAPMLQALRDGPLDRRDLAERLGVSRATSHRHTNTLEAYGMVERRDGPYALTALGRTVTDALVAFKADVTTAALLAPVLEAIDDRTPALPLNAFADARVTTVDGGDPHRPVVRFLSLIRETERLRGFDTWSIAPTYMGEIQERILEGMETELVDSIAVVEDVMDNYPELCVQVCVSGNLTLRLHDALPFGLAIFDDRVGVAVRDPDSGGVRTFLDTADPVARTWAEATFDRIRDESTVLEQFSRKGLREATS